MPPKIALLLCVLFIIVLFIRDIKQKPHISGGLWIPTIWIMLIASRPVSLWLNWGVPVVSDGQEQYLEGSPVDRNVYLALILAGLFILFRRRRNWGLIIRRNIWLVMFLAYCGLSILWSDYSFVAFKRWIKELGNFIMVMIIITELYPAEAIKVVYRRLAYVLLPLSVVFIKYFPEMGRCFTRSGEAMYTGVTTHKNSLGVLCLICFLMFLWNLLQMRVKGFKFSDNREALIYVFFIFMITWLLYMANCATAILCCCLGASILIWMDIPFIKKNAKYIGVYSVIFLSVFVLLELTVDITSVVISVLGRNVTLTGRIPFWGELLVFDVNLLIGKGYMSFWMGDVLDFFAAKYYWQPHQAHNGYLEIYLNLGLIGLLLLICSIVAFYKDIIRRISNDINFQKLRLTFLVVVLFANITEAFFTGLSQLWFVFLLMALASSGTQPVFPKRKSKQPV
jgi:O-antigen ligase